MGLKIKKKEKITQSILQKFYTAKKNFARAKYEMELLDAQVRELIERDAQISPGKYALVAEKVKGRRTPQWKSHFIGLAQRFKAQLGIESGEKFAERILENTPPGDGSLKIDVVDTTKLIQS